MRATVTVVRDVRELVRRPAQHRALDLLPDERNVVGGDRGRAHVRWRHRKQAGDIVLDDGVWCLRGQGNAGVAVDGADVAARASVPLRDGAVITIPDIEVELRFDIVTAGAFERVVRERDVLLLDHGPGRGPGRWRALSVGAGRTIERSLVVAGDPPDRPDELQELAHGLAAETAAAASAGSGPGDGDDEVERCLPRLIASWTGNDGLLYRQFAQRGSGAGAVVAGVPLRELTKRGRGLEPALVVDVCLRALRWLIQGSRGMRYDAWWLGFDGSLHAAPPLVPRAPRDDEGRHMSIGGVPELFPALFRESSDWFTQDDAGSRITRELRRRLMDTYLAGLTPGRQPQPDDIGDLGEALDAFTEAQRALRTPARAELAEIARGLCPDEHRFARELDDEAAAVDAAALTALLDAAPT